MKSKLSPGRKKNGKRRQKNGKSKSKLGQKKNVPILPITDLKLGSTIDGHVAAFTDFGIFIKIPYNLKGKKQKNGGYALLHKSQIMDETVDDVKKLFRIGAELKNLRVININFARGEVGLSLRSQREKRRDVSEFKVGEEYEGKINRVVSYGAFVDVGAKQNALLHISRLSSKRIENIRTLVNEGDTVIVRIISKDEKKQTMAASMLSPEADKYLDTRSKQLDRMRTRAQNSSNQDNQVGLKTEVEYFEDAIRELEASLE